MDAIYQRRSVRQYTIHPVDPADVRTLIDAAIQAPSATNAQPWAFVVIQDAALLRRLSARSKERSLAGLRIGSPLWNHRSILADPAFDIFHGAGTLIVICAQDGTGWPTNEDCCMAGQNLLLAAHGLGLGACPIGFAREALDDPDVKRELGIPDAWTAVMPIVVGYAAETPEPGLRDDPRILCWK
jgi:nitroreductase